MVGTCTSESGADKLELRVADRRGDRVNAAIQLKGKNRAGRDFPFQVELAGERIGWKDRDGWVYSGMVTGLSVSGEWSDPSADQKGRFTLTWDSKRSAKPPVVISVEEAAGLERLRTGLIAPPLGEQTDPDGSDLKAIVAAIDRRCKVNGTNGMVGRLATKHKAEWKAAAEAGDPNAQLLYGYARKYGAGETPAPKAAVTWWRKAAEGGSVQALVELGTASWEGDGVDRNSVEAASLLRKAVEKGKAEGMRMLAHILMNGQGTNKDPIGAIRMFGRAAEAGYSDAMVDIGVAHIVGMGVRYDPVAAARWFQKAIEHGNHMGMFNLAVCYRDGNGVPQDYSKAVAWYHRAADAGNTLCFFNLGSMYEDGRGVPENRVEAIKWYQRAAKEGDRNAIG